MWWPEIKKPIIFVVVVDGVAAAWALRACAISSRFRWYESQQLLSDIALVLKNQQLLLVKSGRRTQRRREKYEANRNVFGDGKKQLRIACDSVVYGENDEKNVCVRVGQCALLRQLPAQHEAPDTSEDDHITAYVFSIGKRGRGRVCARVCMCLLV